MIDDMTPSKPYFLRAIYQWLVDNDCTPYLAVSATVHGVSVPQEYVQDGQITLNLSPSAVMQLVMDNGYIEFNARFSGTPRHVYIPMEAVLGIYARENGQGMAFPEDVLVQSAGVDEEDGLPPEPQPPRPRKTARPTLKVVK